MPLRHVTLFLLASVALAQTPDASIVAAIQHSHGSGSSSSTFLSGNRLQIRRTSLLTLITTAWGIHRETVFGGPSAIDDVRFDVLVQFPPNTTPSEKHPVLQRLLAERFGLITHDDKRPIAVLALVPTGRVPQFHASAADTRPFCNESSAASETTLTCQHITMADLAGRIRNLDSSITKPVIDQTGIEGAFDFTLRFTPLFDYQRAAAAGSSSPGIKFTDALEKAGLRLEARQVTLPVLIIDRVNLEPTPNAPDIAEKLPAASGEFEVAEVKPSKPETVAAGGSIAFRTNGTVEIYAFTLRQLIADSWEVDRTRIENAPKWFDSDRYDIIAKAAPGTPFDDLMPMIKALIVDRFKLQTQTENRPIPAYFLTAGRSPKLKRAADPSARSECVISRGQNGRGADAIPLKVYTCTNMTMAKFVKLIQPQAAGTLRDPVIDRTGLTGAYDFALAWTRTDIAAAAERRKTDEGAASEPTGAITIFDAVSHDLGLKLEGGKTFPQPVLIIDHAEPIARL